MRVFLLWLFVCLPAPSHAYQLPEIPTVEFANPSPWDQVPIVPENEIVHWSLTVNPTLILSYPEKIQKKLKEQVFQYQKTVLSSEEYEKFTTWFSQHTPPSKRNFMRIPVPDLSPRLPASHTKTTSAPRGKTRYPIVFLHGLAGRVKFPIWATGLHYWNGVEKDLGLKGAGFDVHFTQASYLGDSFKRAPELYEGIQAILKKTGAKRVHVECHSQGGLDARVLQSGLGLADQIASITTIATPHLGLKVDDIPLQYKFLLQMTNIWFGQNFFPDFMDFRSPHMEGVFNPAFPYIEGIPFFSYGAKSFGPDEPDHSLAKWSRRTLLRKMSLKIESSYPLKDGKKVLHDGIVPIDATYWGQFMGILGADHLEQVLGGGLFPNTQFYGAHLDMLQELEHTLL